MPLCVSPSPQGGGHSRHAHLDCGEQTGPAAGPGHSTPQRVRPREEELEVRLRGMFGQVQLARAAAVRRGTPQRGLRPLQTRPCYHTLPTRTTAGTLHAHVTDHDGWASDATGCVSILGPPKTDLRPPHHIITDRVFCPLWKKNYRTAIPAL